jgi:protein-S-isoprenylcysteine O-methyltransferase Ste14
MIGVGVVWRSWLHRCRYGTWGIAIFTSREPRHLIRDIALLVLPIALIDQASELAFWPDRISERMLTRPHELLGTVALFGGIALMVQAQLDLGASWRIGIEEGAMPGLVNGGLYTISRNPIFLGMLASLVGFALLIPTFLSSIVVVGTIAGIRAQVLEEEAYLRRTYGADYLAYARRVGRFVPGIGTLR